MGVRPVRVRNMKRWWETGRAIPTARAAARGAHRLPDAQVEAAQPDYVHEPGRPPVIGAHDDAQRLLLALASDDVPLDLRDASRAARRGLDPRRAWGRRQQRRRRRRAGSCVVRARHDRRAVRGRCVVMRRLRLHLRQDLGPRRGRRRRRLMADNLRRRRRAGARRTLQRERKEETLLRSCLVSAVDVTHELAVAVHMPGVAQTLRSELREFKRDDSAIGGDLRITDGRKLRVDWIEVLLGEGEGHDAASLPSVEHHLQHARKALRYRPALR